MSELITRLQLACRSILRAVAAPVRTLLTPVVTPPEFTLHQIDRGPAAGAKIILPKGSQIAEMITGGHYEKCTLSVVAGLVKLSDTCFDIGGHYGYFTLSLAKIAGAGHVHTFEPVQAHANRIKKSAEHSLLSNVTVHEQAVGDEVGNVVMNVADGPDSDDSMAYLEKCGGVDTPAAHEHYRRFVQTTVKSSTLDSLATDLPSPAFIKIDAEGAEAAIIGAGMKMIATAKPRILIETHGVHEALTCAEFFQKLHYRAVLMTDQKTTMPILWIAADDHEAILIVTRVLGREPLILFADGDLHGAGV